MRYSNGNYEAFAHPRKPADADKKSAHIVGGGLAGLATAVFLVITLLSPINNTKTGQKGYNSHF